MGTLEMETDCSGVMTGWFALATGTFEMVTGLCSGVSLGGVSLGGVNLMLRRQADLPHRHSRNSDKLVPRLGVFETARREWFFIECESWGCVECMP